MVDQSRTLQFPSSPVAVEKEHGGAFFVNSAKWLAGLLLGCSCQIGCGDTHQTARESSHTVVASPGVDHGERSAEAAVSEAPEAAVGHLGAPFDRPYQYIGMTIAKAAKATGGKPNAVSNIIIDSDRAHMLLEGDGAVVNFVDVRLKQTAPCSWTRSFDPKPLLRALSIEIADLTVDREAIQSHSYYDHGRRLKVFVQCDGEGGELSVGVGSEGYGR